MSSKYRRDGTSYPAGNQGLLEWARDVERAEYKIVRQDHLPNGYFISTVWLGLDHNFSNQGPPLIFETMVFKSGDDSGEHDYTERYATEEEAIAGHIRAFTEYQDR